MAARVRKRCGTCGKARMVKPREVRCKHVINGSMGPSTQRYCWGLLAPAPIQRATPEGSGLEATLTRLHGRLDDQLKDLQAVTRKIEKTRLAIRAAERSIHRRDNPNPNPQPRRRRRPRIRDIDLPEE